MSDLTKDMTPLQKAVAICALLSEQMRSAEERAEQGAELDREAVLLETAKLVTSAAVNLWPEGPEQMIREIAALAKMDNTMSLDALNRGRRN